MRSHECRRALLRAPSLAWDVLLRGRYSFIYDRMPMLAAGMDRAKRLNLFMSGANLLYRRPRPWSMPLHMQFELTSFCNLRCPVCPTGTRLLGRPPQAMDVALFERVLEETGPYLLTMSLWGWGEPLLHPRLAEMLRVARKYPAVKLLSTNGQNLDQPRVLDALISEPPDYLILALDGLTDETNTRYRVGARMEPALEGIRKLAEMKRARGLRLPVLNMRFIVMKHNQHELPLLEDFARRHEFELLSIRSLYMIESTTNERTREELPPAGERGAGRDGFICQHPFWFPTVFADGTLVLCEQDYGADLSAGRVADGVSFRQLWYSDATARLREQIRDHPEGVSFCRKCPCMGISRTDFNVESRVLTK